MFFHRPSMTSTYDSAESIATPPPESDLHDDQLRNMLASPLYIQEGEASAHRPRVYYSLRENSVSSSSHFRERETCRSVLTQKTVESRSIFRQRRRFLRTSVGPRKRWNFFFKFSDPEEAAITVLEEQRDHLLVQSKSEILKQECKIDTFNTCIREFQRQAHSNRLEMDSVNCGYEESRREQARLHEELAQREKAHQDTRIRNTYEVEGLKRAQAMRIDEFSRHELRENHAIIQELTSQMQELQERMNYMNDSKEFQDEESICNRKIIQRSQSTSNCSKSWWNADPRPKFAT